MRGYADYRMPVAGLYLCGAGAHPGGGVTGAPGHNAAQAVLADLAREASPILPRETGRGTVRSAQRGGWWKGRLTGRFIVVARVSSPPAPPPPCFAWSPSPACPGADAAKRPGRDKRFFRRDNAENCRYSPIMASRFFRIGRAVTGLGMFATKPIKRGTAIATYRGPRITTAEADRLEKRGATYLYTLNKDWTIDGSPR